MRLPLALCAALTLTAAPPSWNSDLSVAVHQAGKEKKPVLVLFTGSDWCPYCISLEKEVFSTPEFEAFAKEAILVKLDYPRRQERTPEKLAANKPLADLIALKDAHKVTGFPTVLWLSPEGRELSRVVSYRKDTGPKAYLAQLSGKK